MKKTIRIEKSIFSNNTSRGNALRRKFDTEGVFALNIMASPGAGKTSVILKTIGALKETYAIAVIEGDIVPIDVRKIRATGVPVVLAQTGGSCHLDGAMMEVALRSLDLRGCELLMVENVGNLVCPANFYLGTHKNIVIASIPEGDDKPYKYQSMFRGADVVLLNKADYLATEPFRMEYFTEGIRVLNPKAVVIPVSCRTGAGFGVWIDWIGEQRKTRSVL